MKDSVNRPEWPSSEGQRKLTRGSDVLMSESKAVICIAPAVPQKTQSHAQAAMPLSQPSSWLSQFITANAPQSANPIMRHSTTKLFLGLFTKFQSM